MENIESIIKEVDEYNQDYIDWTKAWGKKYPILKQYQNEVDVNVYAKNINKLLSRLHNDYGYSTQESMLVLKDILYHEYLKNKDKEK